MFGFRLSGPFDYRRGLRLFLEGPTFETAYDFRLCLRLSTLKNFRTAYDFHTDTQAPGKNFTQALEDVYMYTGPGILQELPPLYTCIQVLGMPIVYMYADAAVEYLYTSIQIEPLPCFIV